VEAHNERKIDPNLEVEGENDGLAELGVLGYEREKEEGNGGGSAEAMDRGRKDQRAQRSERTDQREQRSERKDQRKEIRCRSSKCPTKQKIREKCPTKKDQRKVPNKEEHRESCSH
jgi:hypothetical protein